MDQTTEHLEQLTLPWLAPKDAARPGRCPSARPLIRELPTGDQPRARLLKHGAGVLSTPELLAVVLNAPDGLALAETLLAGFDGLSGLSRAATLELTALPGVGHTRGSDQGRAGPGPTSCWRGRTGRAGQGYFARRGGSASGQRDGASGAGAPAGAGARHQEPCAGQRGCLPG